MDIESVLFYAIKQVLKLEDDEISASRSPLGINAKVNSKYNHKCKQIIIHDMEKECDIIFEEMVSAYTVSEFTRFGTVNVLPIEEETNDNKYIPIIKNGVRINMKW